MSATEKTIASEKIYDGVIIKVEKLTVALENGQTSTREIVRHQGASAVVPVTSDGSFVLTRQYRKPNEFYSIEIPAGKLDPGEDPLDCAKRELEEETGYRAGKLSKLFSIKSTPGFSDEIIHIFMATELEQGQLSPDEDEFITTFIVTQKEAAEMIKDGRITDGKTISGLYGALDLLKTFE